MKKALEYNHFARKVRGGDGDGGKGNEIRNKNDDIGVVVVVGAEI